MMKLGEIQPSQLFISSEKLSRVMGDSTDLTVESIEPIFGNSRFWSLKKGLVKSKNKMIKFD